MRVEVRGAIQRHTAAALTSFLDELANGTRNYRSLHNLTEQIEHQYHGRFLVELLQNAHDCLRAERGPTGRIAIRLQDDEGDFGTLYVANEGRAFTDNDFADLSRLGQSSKDPNRFVGNKGIGFRSVLEICAAPEIVSRSAPGSSAFDGYCFAFRPPFVASFAQELARTVGARTPPSVDLGSGRITLTAGWTKERLDAFWSRWSEARAIEMECRYLSPYLLPIPLTEKAKGLADFERTGYSTVIRLVLKDEAARETAERVLATFGAEDLLFLESAREVSMTIKAQTTVYRRESRKLKNAGDDRSDWEKVDLVTVVPGSEARAPLSYWVWTRTIGGKSDRKGAAALKEAGAKLPGKWPEVQEAALSLAVRLGAVAADGRFSIFLPTAQKTGSCLHINAPFFGEMNRASIPFDEPFNSLLLDCAAALSVRLLRTLRGEDDDSGTACADLIAFRGEAEQSVYWQALRRHASVAKVDLGKLPCIRTSRGWRTLRDSAPIPALPAAAVFTEALMAQAAPYPYPIPALASRLGYLDRSHRALFGNSFTPNESQKADLVEAAIRTLAEDAAQSAETWGKIWNDVSRLVPASDYSAHPLLGRKVLLSGGRLVARTKDGRTIFTLPLDDEPADGDQGIRNVPEMLRRKMGFLDEAIPMVKVVDGRRTKSPVRDYLLRGNPPLVEDFRRRTVFASVLRPLAARAGNVSLAGSDADLMRDILHWGIRLVETARGRETLTDQLAHLRVPCRGGWFAVAEASFGPGWVAKPDPGADLEALLAKEPGGSARLALPPDHPAWGTNASEWRDILLEARLARGLRLLPVDPAAWASSIDLSRTHISLPAGAPPGVPAAIWERYRSAVLSPLRAPYQSQYRFQIGGLFLPHAFGRWADLVPTDRAALTRALFISLGEWPDSWGSAHAEKQGGEPHTVRFPSPLRYWLENEAWITFERDGEFRSFRPAELIYIPSAKLTDGRWRFSHLDHLPMDLVRLAEASPGVLDALRRLGIVDFPSDEPSSDVRFLEALGTSVARGRIGPEHRDVFLGQVYAAWTAFEPDETDAFPTAVVCQKGSEITLLRREGTELAYLPDTRSELTEVLKREEKPVVHIQPGAGKRLREAFAQTFGERVRPLSGVTLDPLVGGVRRRESGAEAPLQDSELWWLPVVALATASYAGSTSWGTHAKSFGVGLDTLRRAKLLRASPITLRGSYGNDVLLDRAVGATWAGDGGVLLIDPTAPEYWRDLAEAVGDLLDRADLESPLRLVFAAIARAPEVDEALIAAALREVHINASQLSEVRKTWLGDVSWLLQRLRPAIRFLDPNVALADFEEATSKEELEAVLRGADSQVPASDLLTFAQVARNDEEMGRWLYERLGSKAERASWNVVLDLLGSPHRKLRNSDAEKEFAAHLADCRNSYCAILRTLAAGAANPAQFYTAALEKYDALKLPEDVAWQTWNVGLGEALAAVLSLLRASSASEPINAAFADCPTIEELRRRLEGLGLSPSKDPAEILRLNVEQCKRQRELLRRCGVLIAQKGSADALTWSRLSESTTDPIAARLKEGLGYLRELPFSECLEVALGSLPEGPIRDQLEKSTHGAQNGEGVLAALKLAATDFDKVDELLHRAQDDQVRKRRQMNICGADFDTEETNLSNLLQHLEKVLPDAQAPGIELSLFASLGSLRARRGGGGRSDGTTPRPARSPMRRLTSQQRDVIGLVGEILVWRALKQKHAVTAANWLSSGAVHVFPDAKGDDEAGCDFRLRIGNITYDIEVKATSGDEPEFELGSSEVRLALMRRRSRKEKFVIAHVLQALSTRPEIRLLPNPYEPAHEGNFFFRGDGGFTVSYRPEISVDDL